MSEVLMQRNIVSICLESGLVAEQRSRLMAASMGRDGVLVLTRLVLPRDWMGVSKLIDLTIPAFPRLIVHVHSLSWPVRERIIQKRRKGEKEKSRKGEKGEGVAKS